MSIDFRQMPTQQEGESFVDFFKRKWEWLHAHGITSVYEDMYWSEAGCEWRAHTYGCDCCSTWYGMTTAEAIPNLEYILHQAKQRVSTIKARLARARRMQRIEDS